MASLSIAVIVLSGCGGSAGDQTPGPSTLPSGPNPFETTPTPDVPEQRSDIKFPLPAQRTLKAGSVMLQVTYSSSLSANEWRADGTKPLRVVVAAYNPRDRKQEVYLQRLMVTATPQDETGPTEEPKQVEDASEINPGYYFRSPTTYNQIVVFPSVDSDPTKVTFKLTYEILVKINAPRDYAKQTGEDTLTVPLTK